MKNLKPQQASELLATYGINRTVATLAKLRFEGRGPAFRSAGRAVLYPEEEVIKWAEEMLGPLQNNTGGCGTGK